MITDLNVPLCEELSLAFNLLPALVYPEGVVPGHHDAAYSVLALVTDLLPPPVFSS